MLSHRYRSCDILCLCEIKETYKSEFTELQRKDTYYGRKINSICYLGNNRRIIIVMGIYDFNSKKAKPFGFWANAEVAPIEDVKGYNRALGILWCVYGVLFTLIGLPLLDGQNSGLIIIPILGAMLISIAAMVAYVVGIEPKYRKKK